MEKTKCKYYVSTKVISLVPGMTKAVIPTLLKKDIVAVSVGVNDGTSPPAVPKIFTWKFDDENEIVAMWHPGNNKFVTLIINIVPTIRKTVNIV